MLERPRLICKPSPAATRFLLTQNQRVRLRADLPPWTQAHLRAAPVLCEALSLWLQSPLSLVLDVDIPDPSSVLGLCAAFGFGEAPHYEVQVLGPGPKRRPEPLRSFRNLQTLEQALRGGT